MASQPIQIPSSNPAGKNQTNPSTGGVATPAAAVPMATQPTGTATPAASNPYMPVATPAQAVNPSSGGVPDATGLSSSTANVAGSDGGLTKQLVDIYGKGVGGAEANLLENMSGVDSATLQQFEQSLVPQEAVAQSNLNAALGAGGVSANSSVAALGDANLQSQEFAAVSGEKANLLQSQEQLSAQILGGMQQSAQSEVASSGWDVFGQVMSGIGADSEGIMKGLGAMGVSF